MRQYRITDFAELHQLVECHPSEAGLGWIFRGQADASWPVVPLAGRPEYNTGTELGRFREWRTRAIAYADSIPENDWEALALAQHHGLAARLLDWTHNPLILQPDEKNKMADSNELRVTLKKTATDYIDCCNKGTVDAVLSLRTDTCKHTHLPSSLGVPTYNKAEYGAFFGQFIGVMNDSSIRIADDKEMVVDVESRKVVMHTKAKANTPVGEYENEYMWILTMTEDGKMIDDIVEFCDSTRAVDLMKKLQAQENA